MSLAAQAQSPAAVKTEPKVLPNQAAQPQKVLPNQAAQPQKVLRYAFPVAETGFDPARIVDLYSRIVTAHIFESLYTYDHLARPSKIKPLSL